MQPHCTEHFQETIIVNWRKNGSPVMKQSYTHYITLFWFHNYFLGHCSLSGRVWKQKALDNTEWHGWSEIPLLLLSKKFNLSFHLPSSLIIIVNNTINSNHHMFIWDEYAYIGMDIWAPRREFYSLHPYYLPSIVTLMKSKGIWYY